MAFRKPPSTKISSKPKSGKNNPGFRSMPATRTPSDAINKQNKQIEAGAKRRQKSISTVIKLGAEKTKENATRAVHAAVERVKKLNIIKKQKEKANKEHNASASYARASSTIPTPPHTPTAGSLGESVIKKYVKPKPKQQIRNISGMNATFGSSGSSGTDSQATTDHPYEATRYNIPFERGDSLKTPIGYDATMDAEDKKKQLGRRKAMKLVKVSETFGGEGIPSGAMTSRLDASETPTNSEEKPKNYVIKKTFKVKR